MVSTRSVKNVKFSEGERVLCYEPDPAKTKVLYNSKVLGIGTKKDENGRNVTHFLIHFQGWNSTWDRFVTEDFILKDTEENRKLQKQLAEKAQLTVGLNLYRRGRKKRLSRAGSDGERGLKGGGGGGSESDGEPEPKAPAYHSSFSPALMNILELDNLLVNKQNKLLKLPASPNVLEILEMYMREFTISQIKLMCHRRGHLRPTAGKNAHVTVHDVTSRANLCREIADGLRVYMDFMTEPSLLYGKERSQFKEFTNKPKELFIPEPIVMKIEEERRKLEEIEKLKQESLLLKQTQQEEQMKHKEVDKKDPSDLKHNAESTLLSKIKIEKEDDYDITPKHNVETKNTKEIKQEKELVEKEIKKEKEEIKLEKDVKGGKQEDDSKDQKVKKSEKRHHGRELRERPPKDQKDQKTSCLKQTPHREPIDTERRRSLRSHGDSHQPASGQQLTPEKQSSASDKPASGPEKHGSASEKRTVTHPSSPPPLLIPAVTSASAPHPQPSTSHNHVEAKPPLLTHMSSKHDASEQKESVDLATFLGEDVVKGGDNLILRPLTQAQLDHLKRLVNRKVVTESFYRKSCSETTTPPCLLYGATHLARALVKIPEIFSHSEHPESKMTIIQDYLDEFSKFLEDRSEWFGESHYCDNTYSEITPEETSEVK